jgi:hypothetical protein
MSRVVRTTVGQHRDMQSGWPFGALIYYDIRNDEFVVGQEVVIITSDEYDRLKAQTSS